MTDVKSGEKGPMELTLGYSPCPNDTYIFNAIAEKKIGIEGIRFSHRLLDVETLNEMAFKGTLDVTKLSFQAYFNVKDNYQLLQSGSALGYDCGPVLISKKQVVKKDLKHCRVVFPGEWTTAHLLFRLWAPEVQNRFFVPYEKIFSILENGEADCGVIIHESRFTFEKMGFHSIVDLGAWWEKETKMPIPLGCIAARKSLGEKVIQKIEQLIRESIQKAEDDPDATLPYIKMYAQEMAEEVLKKHIHTFVNRFSLDLGGKGNDAVATLEQMAKAAGVIK